ncbi:MAG TPA: 5-deoxy-glucuronate isomerase [Acidobacteriaceae bacterium]|jgi:5-deoxy-glucuronate isomerase
MSKRLITGTAGERGRRIFIRPGNSSMKQLTYGRIRLCNIPSQITFSNEDQETGLICVGGSGFITAGEQRFGIKANEALYVPKGMTIIVETSTTIDLVECSAPVDGDYPLQFVSAESVQADEKLHFFSGSDGSRREINILLGANIQAGRLVAGITRSLPGNWTSWPPHEHAAMLEEIYVYVEMPEPAFGLQLVYTDEISPAEVEVVREGDAVLLPAGYHPNVAIPGSSLNFVWIMAAHREVLDRKWGVVEVDPRFT